MLWQRDRRRGSLNAPRRRLSAMAESTPSPAATRLAELLARTALADQAAFAELYRLTASHLYAVALRILREPAPPRTLLQEAFVSVWHHAGSYDAAKSEAADLARQHRAQSLPRPACGGASPTP